MLNLEKKYVYSILSLIIITLGIFVVNAYGTEVPSVLGHTPGEIESGTFASPSIYSFKGPIAVGVDPTQSGVINLHSQTGASNLISLENSAGSFIVKRAGTSVLNLNTQGQLTPSGGLCLGTDCRTAWPTTSPNSVLLDSPILLYCKSPSNYLGKWTACTSQVTSSFSGTIQAGSNGIPAGTKEVLLYGHLDADTNSCHDHIIFKQPSQSNWKYLVNNNWASYYPNSNSVWVPLDENGRLEWKFNSSYSSSPCTTGVEEYRLEIQGYK